MAQMKQEYIFAFYAFLILIFQYGGYYISLGASSTLNTEFGLIGGLIGIVFSLILWFTVGKVNSY